MPYTQAVALPIMLQIEPPTLSTRPLAADTALPPRA